MAHSTQARRARDKGRDDSVTSEGRDTYDVKAQGASLIQIEHGFGKSSIVILWLSAFISAAAVIGLVVAVIAYHSLIPHVNTLQYDLDKIRAQLIEQDLYEPTGH